MPGSSHVHPSERNGAVSEKDLSTTTIIVWVGDYMDSIRLSRSSRDVPEC
jgi:hypothetical protein